MRVNDYPPPSYAGYVWWANRRVWLSDTTHGTRSFEDTPSGLAALRIALLDLADQRQTVAVAQAQHVPTAHDSEGRVRRADTLFD